MRWLNGCFDEDERIAREATEDVGVPEWIGSDQSGHAWRYNYGGVWGVTDGAASNAPEVVLTDFAGIQSHITEHDPARVLREIDSKRQLLADIVAEPHASVKPGGSTTIYCAADSGEPCDCGRDARVTRQLRLLALPYSHRPGFAEAVAALG